MVRGRRLKYPPESRPGAHKLPTGHTWQFIPPALSFQSVSFQVNGKMRGAIEVEVDTAQDGAVAAARSIPAVAKQLDGKDIKKVIFVPGEQC